MKELSLRQRVIACYESDINGKQSQNPGQIINISWLTINKIVARVFAVKMDDGLIDTFAESHIFPEEPVDNV